LKISNGFKKTAAIVVIMLFIFSAILMTAPVTTAATSNPPEPSFTFLSVAPNPIGVGQTTTLSMWIYPLPPTANTRYGNLTLTVTKPDGTKQEFGPALDGPLGNFYWNFAPSVAGNYTVVAHCNGGQWTAAQVGTAYVPLGDLTRLPSDSAAVTLTVQDDAIQFWPDTPLPTEYWTFPINAQNYAWASLGGSWTGIVYDTMSGTNAWTQGSQTAHVLWNRQMAFGGIDGGFFGANSYAGGCQYEDKGPLNIVLNGRCYMYSFDQSAGWGDRNLYNTLDCMDIATGKVLWSRNMSITAGQIYEYNSANQVGLHAYLWSLSAPTYKMYDAFNGQWIMDIANVSTGTGTVTCWLADTAGCGPYASGKGGLQLYMLNVQNGWMAMWNQSKFFMSDGLNDGAITYQAQTEKDQYGIYGGQWRPRNITGAAAQWARGIQWNVTIPKEPTTIYTFVIDPTTRIGVADTYFTVSNFVSMYSYNIPANGVGVAKLAGPVNFTGAMLTRNVVGNGLMGRFDMARMRYTFWDAKTGAKSFDTDPLTNPWGTVTVGDAFYGDKFYVAGYDGLYCFDANTGHVIWKQLNPNSGMQTPYGIWLGKLSGFKITGDLVYYQTGIWHNTEIYARGDRTYCFNASTGAQIWNMSGYSDLRGCANGYTQVFNQYDQCMYTFAKGPSATTVSADQSVSGANVLIQGSVLDKSPGKANGYAAISDTWMTQWMEYIYEQQPKPANAIGVPVSIDAYDPNGNLIHLGRRNKR